MTEPVLGHCFADTYQMARAAFLYACAAAGGAIVSHRHPLPGPSGEPLFLDEARFGRPDAQRVLFINAGTHGIEGLCGSGVQTFLLRGDLAKRLPDDVALVLVHGVNPWGFAWSRRVNEDNVDLNRNFLDHRAPHPDNPDYDRLYDVLNPTQLDEGKAAEFVAAIQRFQAEHGFEAVYRSLSGGQYRHPRGLQYGGQTPVWSNRVLRALWARHAGAADLAVLIDLHSGLGPRGFGLLLQTAPEDSVDAQLAHAWWPDVARSEPAVGSNAALVSGLMGPAFTASQPAAAVGIVLEFGTLDMTEVMLAIQADNWLHHHGRRDSDMGRVIAQRMRDAFYIDAEDWQTAVCDRARQVVDACLDGMAAFPKSSARNVPRVRSARPTDVDVLVRFATAMAQETEARDLDLPTLSAGLVALLSDPTLGRAFVVEEGDEIVATYTLTQEWSDWRNGMFWWIQSVYVRPEHRRRGHYRRMHDHATALAARDPSVCGIRLYVEHENRDARATYAALGMSETGYRLYEQSTRGTA